MGPAEWSGRDSNPRPPGCKPGALPAELPPRTSYKITGCAAGAPIRNRVVCTKVCTVLTPAAPAARRAAAPHAARLRHRAVGSSAATSRCSSNPPPRRRPRRASMNDSPCSKLRSSGLASALNTLVHISARRLSDCCSLALLRGLRCSWYSANTLAHVTRPAVSSAPPARSFAACSSAYVFAALERPPGREWGRLGRYRSARAPARAPISPH